MNTRLIPKINAIDLFCGVGGLTHGLIRGGIKVKAGIDNDANCKYPYEKNNAASFLERDVADITTNEVNKLFDTDGLKLLAGCAPCQPFSSYSRSGRGIKYESQWPLLLKFGKLISEIKPDLVTMENVPQLAEHQVFDDFLNSLAGYNIWWSVVQCENLGIPQTRRRLVLLASKLGNEELKIDFEPNRKVTVREAIGSLMPIEAGQKNHIDPLHVAPALSSNNLKRIRASVPGGTWRDWPDELQAECHKKKSGATYPSVYGRMEWNKPSPTITTQCYGYGNGRFGHPEQDRALTLREASIIQTFPQNYLFADESSKVRFNIMGKMIGNAVPVKLGEVIASALIKHVNNHYAAKRDPKEVVHYE